MNDTSIHLNSIVVNAGLCNSVLYLCCSLRTIQIFDVKVWGLNVTYGLKGLTYYLSYSILR